MDNHVFESNISQSQNQSEHQQPQNQQSGPAHSAFGNVAREIKDTGSPNNTKQQHLYNKKNDILQKSKPSQPPISGKVAVTELSPQALSKNKDLQAVGGGQNRPMSDVKDLGVVGGKKRNDQNDSQSAINLTSTKEDSFQKLYSKELDLDEDEVPIILHELNDSAIHFISHEQYERSLSLLQKAQTLLDRLKFQKNPKDRFLIQVTMHNMALCFQKMGALEECALCLDACLHQINSQYLAPTFTKKPTKKLKKLKYECKIHMQVCALLSQLHRHEEALLHAKQAVQISQYLINDLVSLCEINVEKTLQAKKNEQEVHEEQERQKNDQLSQTSSQADLIYYDHSISMLERTALRVFPILKEIQNRMVKHKDIAGHEKTTDHVLDPSVLLDQSIVDSQPLNMRVLLGYLNQSEWLYLLNIGNIMQITPLTIHDLYSNQKIDVELSRDSILEKITFLAISYFCVSTELRFLVSSKEKLSFDPVYVKAESEFWHGKALEISCGFLPSESPLVTHVLSSYQKHHAPVQQAIPENEEEDQGLRVIRPEKGIDKAQFQPIVRQNKHLNIALSPLRLSPNNHRLQKDKKKQQPKKISTRETGVLANLQPPQLPQARPKMHPPQPQTQPQPQGKKNESDDQDDEAQELLQAVALHNPSRRSIEFTSADAKKDKNNGVAANHRDPGVPGTEDVVEYELQSFDQSEIIHQQQPKKAPLSRQSHRDGDQTATPGRQVDHNNKIQMAVPSPNVLASAMQRDQRESLSQASINERPAQLQQYDSSSKLKTQRHEKNEIEKFALDKQQSSSFQELPKQDSTLLDEPHPQVSFSQSKRDEIISESKQLVSSDNPSKQMKEQQDHEIQRISVNNFVQGNQTSTINSSQAIDVNFETAKQYPSIRSGAKTDQQQLGAPPRPSAAKQSSFEPTHKQDRTTPDVGDIQQPKKYLQIKNLDERVTPDIRSTQLRHNVNANAGQSHRSRSKGKLNKKKGVLTQPQTNQNSANVTGQDPLRHAKEVTQFGTTTLDKKQQQRAAHSLESDNAGQEDSTHHSVQIKTRNQQISTSKQGVVKTTAAQSSSATSKSVRPVTSVETRGPDLHHNQRPPSSNTGVSGKQERPDSRRMIGGKRRQIKDQQQTAKTEIAAARSNSGGRRNNNNNNLSNQQHPPTQQNPQAQLYKTNDLITQQQQFNIGNSQQQPSAQLVSSTSSNFKTYQQTRKAVTTHSTQASNSPNKRIPSAKQFSEGTTSGSAVALKTTKPTTSGIQDPVLIGQNLNQSRSTIENNNSLFVDRSMNEQLMLNNSSFELGTQNRSRSFAKTGALSQQNSRDVIVSSKKKNVAHPTSQNMGAASSKSQSKQQKAANKEIFNYLNQATQAQKSINNLLQAQQQQPQTQSQQQQQNKFQNNSNHQHESDYHRKQLLIKQALEMQNQTHHQQHHQAKDSRQKSSTKTLQHHQQAQSNKTQIGFQTHSSSVQSQISHAGQIAQSKPQSRSSQGLRKSQNNIQKEQSGQTAHQQSQKVLSAQAQVHQLNTLDPQALAVINQMLTLKSGQQSQQSTQQLYSQLLQMNQTVAGQTGHQVALVQTVAAPATSQKKQQKTHTMIKKFLKERAGPQQTTAMQSSHSAILNQNTAAQNRVGHSQSPNPGPPSSALRLGTATTLIDNFIQAPFLASSANGGLPTSKQAHTTKAAAETGKQARNFVNQQQQKIMYPAASKSSSQQQTSAAVTTTPSTLQKQQNSYYNEASQPPRKGAQERFDKKQANALGCAEPGQREPTPVYHHVPYQKPEDKHEQQYPMQQKMGNSAKQQLISMYKSIKGESGARH